MITQKELEAMKPFTIFATGTTEGRRWVAVRGGGPDWTVYSDNPARDERTIAQTGVKLWKPTALRLVAVDEDVANAYRN